MKLFAPTQGHFQARVRVPNQTDAMRTLLKVNGAQIGAWNIEISLLPASDSNADKLRCVGLLKELLGCNSIYLCVISHAWQILFLALCKIVYVGFGARGTGCD